MGAASLLWKTQLHAEMLQLDLGKVRNSVEERVDGRGDEMVEVEASRVWALGNLATMQELAANAGTVSCSVVQPFSLFFFVHEQLTVHDDEND